MLREGKQSLATGSKLGVPMSRTKRIQQVRTLIPFVFTFANAFFGFLSITKSLEGEFVVAAWLILLAGVMDAFDGRLARYFGTAGELGGELDSLCDAISFCVAPAILLYSWYLHDFGHAGVFSVVVGMYLCAGLFRLARFNLGTKEESLFFFGLPTTIAGAFLAFLIVYHNWFEHKPALHFVFNKASLVGIVASFAFLMISSVRFPSFKKPNLSLRMPLTYVKLLIVIALMLWCWHHGYPFFLLLLTAYIGGSLLRVPFLKAYQRVARYKKKLR